jgi:hypothetical protein
MDKEKKVATDGDIKKWLVLRWISTGLFYQQAYVIRSTV